MATPLITIDGPAASGKTSVSRGLAKNFGWKWVSTGAFYRGIALIAGKKNVDLASESQIVDIVESPDWQIKLEQENTEFYYENINVTDQIYAEHVGNIASQISQFPKFRTALLAAQRSCTNISTGLIAEGRDCGSVVFPGADLKFYLTAHSGSRAKRRASQEGRSLEATKEQQKQRDQQDSNRKAAPLQIPQNAEVIDTTQMNLDQVVAHLATIVKDRLKV